MNPTPIDQFQVYMAWPEETIIEQLDVFKHGENGMYNGAGIPELAAGLHCLDFLTRASTMSEETQLMVESAMMEADMRIGLLTQQENYELSQKETYEKIEQCLYTLQMGLKSIQAGFKRIDTQDVMDALALRRRLRQ